MSVKKICSEHMWESYNRIEADVLHQKQSKSIMYLSGPAELGGHRNGGPQLLSLSRRDSNYHSALSEKKQKNR